MISDFPDAALVKNLEKNVELNIGSVSPVNDHIAQTRAAVRPIPFQLLVQHIGLTKNGPPGFHLGFFPRRPLLYLDGFRFLEIRPHLVIRSRLQPFSTPGTPQDMSIVYHTIFLYLDQLFLDKIDLTLKSFITTSRSHERT